MLDFNIGTYRKWLETNSKLDNVFSVPSLKELVFHLLMGKNYRLMTENDTKDKLLTTYVWLTEVVNDAQEKYGNKWQSGLLDDLMKIDKKTEEHNNLLLWLLGLTAKGAVNLSVDISEFPEIMKEMVKHCNKLFKSMNRVNYLDNSWLLLMAGSATLNIRGSRKSVVGKKLEHVFLNALLTLLGLTKDKNYWLRIGRDIEVDREADAEIETKRGKIRIEVGLIAPGNQEVIEDKISRVGRNGIVIYDKLGPKSKVYQTAEKNVVKLVQIRNSNPLAAVFEYIKPMVPTELIAPFKNEEELRARISNLDEKIFRID